MTRRSPNEKQKQLANILATEARPFHAARRSPEGKGKNSKKFPPQYHGQKKKGEADAGASILGNGKGSRAVYTGGGGGGGARGEEGEKGRHRGFVGLGGGTSEGHSSSRKLPSSLLKEGGVPQKLRNHSTEGGRQG